MTDEARIHFCGGQAAPDTAPPFLIEKDANCADCGQVHDMEVCPECGSDIGFIYGFMGGPLGSWAFCEEFCGWKHLMDEDTEGMEE